MNIIDAAFEQGKELATVEGTVYRLVSVVFSCAPDSPPIPYCVAVDWHGTTIAQLAKKDAEIALLKARIIELERRSAPPPKPIEELLPEPVTNSAPVSRHYSCPRCDFRSLSARGVSSHAWAKHKLRVNWGALDS